MKNIIIVGLVMVGLIVVASVNATGIKAPPDPPLIDLKELFPYNTVVLQGCLYITYKVSPTQRGLVHAGSCKNPVHSIYGRIANNAG